MSDAFDTVVVGAGPAGSAAAIALARAGCRVLLLDRKAFPRDKPCGDLVGARALAAAQRLGVSRAALDAFHPISGAVITSDAGPLDLAPGSAWGRRFLAGSDARVVPRAIFDDVLRQTAVDAGAAFRRAVVRHVGPWQDGVRTVAATGDDGSVEIAARAVIVAGGYGCRVAPDLSPDASDDRAARGIAMRGYFRNVSCPADRIVFSLDRWLLPGYGWVFPLPGGANVGVGTLVSASGGKHEDAHLHQLWRRFTREPRSPAAPWLNEAVQEGQPKTWPLDLGPRRRRLVANGVLVAGEAAALVGPLTGAGIAFALESGEMAGQAVAAALAAGDARRERLDPYGRAVRRQTAPWLRAELLAQRYLANPDNVDRFFGIVRPLPPTGALGAKLLLHLG